MASSLDKARQENAEAADRIVMNVHRYWGYGRFCGHRWKRGFWFRLYGYGPHIARDRLVLFSERYGFRKIWRLGRWSFEWLRP